MSSSFDYVVVGAGSAGCVVAARLSEQPQVRVLLLELGGDGSNPALPDTDVSRLPELWAPSAPENWGYRTTPQPGLAGRSLDIARGKLVGGSGAINAMIYVRGSRFDFDEWSALGNRGWSYADALPYFKRSERYHGAAGAYHGQAGPLSVIDYRKPSELSFAFVEAAAELGHTRKLCDFNAESQTGGAGFYQSTRSPEGARVSAATAFLTPAAQRENLRLLSGVRATRVLFEGQRAVGVEYASQGKLECVRAEREVVLCCGAFETPKLLLLSGVGPAAELARHGIAVVQELSGVGSNLHDHLMLGVGFASKLALDRPELLAEAGLFLSPSEQVAPQLQYFFGPLQFVAAEYRTQGPAFTCTPILLRPRSRGSLRLASRDPAALARVDPGYLQHDDDIAVLRQGIRYARELAHCQPFDAFRGRELAPGDRVVSDAELDQYIRRVATTVWHPAGSCRMGTDTAAVVDDELRVHGLSGLRIADASIMPRLVSGNPNAAVMMIAERAVDLLLGRQPCEPARDQRERAAALRLGQAPLASGAAAARARGAYAEPLQRFLGALIEGREPQRYLYRLVVEQLSSSRSGPGALLCLASCEAFGGDPERALPSAAAIALRQAAFAAHDELELEHDDGGAGLGRRHGLPLALNAGDALSALGLRALKQNSARLGADEALSVLGELDHASLEAFEGRALELGWLAARDFNVGDQAYLLMLLKKVGWAGYIQPARLGALLAGVERDKLERFHRFGYFLAAAREIARDARDVARDARYVLGGRRTLIQTHLFEHGSRAERERLTALAARPRAERLPRDAGWLRDAVRAHGSLEHARQVARDFGEAAARELPQAYAGANEGEALALLRSLTSDFAAGHVVEQVTQERQVGAG